MTRFLELFPAFRALQRTVEDLTNEKLLLQDRLDQSVAERDRMWKLAEDAREGERVALQMQVNINLQRQGFAALYENAPHLPQEPHQPPENPIVPGRPLPSQAVDSIRRKFIHGLVETYSKQSA